MMIKYMQHHWRYMASYYRLAMYTLSFIAFLGLQMSILTCETNIHVDYLDGKVSQVSHSHNGANGQVSMDQTCEIHASHVFIHLTSFILGDCKILKKQIEHLAMLNIINISYQIDHPPKLIRT